MRSEQFRVPAFLALLGCLLAAGAAALLPVFGNSTPAAGAPPQEYWHLRYGNPSGATEDAADKDNFLMKKPYFALSYNNTKGTPNWASWRLVAEDLGEADRVPFYSDDTLPAGFKVVKPKDYTGSGFDRGHMCNHSDRAATDESSEATFVMTNMIPQSPNNNQKAWDQLEEYCRSLARKGKELYIIAGPAGKGGEGKNGFKTTLAGGKIVVPAKTWKVILVLKKGGQVDKHTRLIGVIMPNTQEIGYEWAQFRVPVKEIEELTGYTFFDKADADILAPLKEERDAVPIPPPVPPHHGN